MNSMSANLRNRRGLGEDFLPGSMAETPWTPEGTGTGPTTYAVGASPGTDALSSLVGLAQTPVLGVPLWLVAAGAWLWTRRR